jgi:hypothetical protein
METLRFTKSRSGACTGVASVGAGGSRRRIRCTCQRNTSRSDLVTDPA